MSNFKKYRRTNVAEMVPWESVPHANGSQLLHLTQLNISVSQTDIDNGSPKLGDMIARNPNNHDDKWLVAAKYFNENFEEI